jgi:hypothetical protein
MLTLLFPSAANYGGAAGRRSTMFGKNFTQFVLLPDMERSKSAWRPDTSPRLFCQKGIALK